MSRITTDEYLITTACGQERVFKANGTATNWFKLHKKRCACCKGAEVCSAEMEHKVRYNNKTSVETAELLRKEYIKDHKSTFDF